MVLGFIPLDVVGTEAVVICNDMYYIVVVFGNQIECSTGRCPELFTLICITLSS